MLSARSVYSSVENFKWLKSFVYVNCYLLQDDLVNDKLFLMLLSLIFKFCLLVFKITYKRKVYYVDTILYHLRHIFPWKQV